MKILAVGDIVGKPGREYIYRNLNKIRDRYGIDFVIANGENAATSNGITPEIADELVNRGVDVITMGNHTFATKAAGAALEENSRLIRPLNFPPEFEGRGYVETDLGFASVAVINLIGRVNMTPADCPFRAAEKALKEIESDIIIVDFHAETTSERLAMGNFLDGKVQAVFGTHTHVQTADDADFAKWHGVHFRPGNDGDYGLNPGNKKRNYIDFYYNAGKRQRFEKAEDGEVWFNGCIFEIDNKTKKTVSVERLRFSKI